MIPGKILKFLETSSAAIAGTRNERMVPSLHRVSAWRLDADGETLSCAISGNYTPNLIANLENNGQLAVTITEVVSHETYQFKGRYTGHHPATPADIALFEAKRGRFVDALGILFPELPEDIGGAYLLEPTIVVQCKVREIFLQTPGPGAGSRLFPPEGT